MGDANNYDNVNLKIGRKTQKQEEDYRIFLFKKRRRIKIR